MDSWPAWRRAPRFRYIRDDRFICHKRQTCDSHRNSAVRYISHYRHKRYELPFVTTAIDGLYPNDRVFASPLVQTTQIAEPDIWSQKLGGLAGLNGVCGSSGDVNSHATVKFCQR
jgi:hypothetical protein